ncbi:Na+/H+ antiporter [Psychromicrobium lacuslunae]|uniref:Sodium:proton antiporter n=1 Tax=Psychromicrobium lacuslunae TaxID=1618207 RepID=A0A0D4BYC9_9MICC|nr:Na+/H+ antiporter [Psychromicrobium lacuslunae]AJT41324.1 sodium:proton antiporter [Psychromicrobium lacuslunae]
MEFIGVLLAIVLVVCAVSAIGKRINISAPLLLVVVGAAASFIPQVEVELNPEIILVAILPPLLFAAAYQTSLVDFRSNRRAIGLLSVGYVIFTALGVGLVAYWVFPGISLAAAIALGAVVAPPDAVAATAIARRVGMPRRVVSILEGESLVNDATALVTLRAAIAATGGVISVWQTGAQFLWAAGGGVVIGVVVAIILTFIRKRVRNVAINTSMSLAAPFLAYLPAEELHLFDMPASGVLAVVVCGLLMGFKSPAMPGGASRMSQRSNWTTVQFLLENSVFLIIGLQAKTIIQEVQEDSLGLAAIWWGCLAVLVAVLLLRPIWVFPATYLPRLIPAVRQADPNPSWTSPAIISWAGMRGVVTLAAALTLPTELPHREVLILAALVVVGGTLALQGFTLPALVRTLKVRGPDKREDLLSEAAVMQRATSAGVAHLREITTDDDPPEVLAMLKRRTQERGLAAWERLGRPGSEAMTPSQRYAQLRQEMLDAERQEVLSLRRGGDYPHEVLAEVLNRLDVEESMLESALEDPEFDDPTEESITEGGCEHLQAARDRPVPETLVCEDCVKEGTSTVHYRMCLSCGKVACCDSSVGRHADRHYRQSGHPVMRSVETGESWRWCYPDELLG